MTETSNSGPEPRTVAAAPRAIGGSTEVIHVNDYCYRGNVNADGTWHVKRWLCDRSEHDRGSERLESPDIPEIPARVLVALEEFGARGTSR